MWRIQPDLIIELGTSGGGGAFFYATVMQYYNPHGRVITIDPALQSDTQGVGPLRDWNQDLIKAHCAHCMPANETALWRSGMIRFIRGFPDAADVLKQVEPHRADKCTAMARHAVLVVASNPHSTGGRVRLRRSRRSPRSQRR